MTAYSLSLFFFFTWITEEAFKWVKINFFIEFFSSFWAAYFEHFHITEKPVTKFGFVGKHVGERHCR